MVIRTYISIITLNVNRLNAPVKRQSVPEWIFLKDSHICCYKRLTSELKTHT